MWPRLLSQLVELLPHATRLIPMADAYLSTRRETDKSRAAALAAMATGIREEINSVGGSVASLSRHVLEQKQQIAEQRQQIAALEESLAATETHRLAVTRQLEWITNDLNSMRLWIKFGVVTIILLLVGISALTVQMFRLH